MSKRRKSAPIFTWENTYGIAKSTWLPEELWATIRELAALPNLDECYISIEELDIDIPESPTL